MKGEQTEKELAKKRDRESERSGRIKEQRVEKLTMAHNGLVGIH